MPPCIPASDARHASVAASVVPRLKPLPILDASHASALLGFSRSFTHYTTYYYVELYLFLFLYKVKKEERQERQTVGTRMNTGFGGASQNFNFRGW